MSSIVVVKNGNVDGALKMMKQKNTDIRLRQERLKYWNLAW